MMKKEITILIVDDHQLIRETWTFILNSDPRLRVIAQCGNAGEAIQLAKELKPHIVILDINMSPISGIEAASDIRKHAPGSKIIGVTVHSQVSYVKKLLKLGATGYVTKNSPHSELIDAIINVSEGRRYICSEVKNKLAEQVFELNNTGMDVLTSREVEVIKHVAQGLSSKEISAEMNISQKTVEVHRYQVLKKLNIRNSAALVNYINSTQMTIE